MGPTPRARSKLRWNTRLLSLVFLLLCCLAPGAGAQTEALARSQWADIDTLLALSRDGARLYAQDEVKLSGDQYCSQAVALADAGEFRESVRAASKALHLAETTGSPHLHATALRNLAIVYSYAGLLDKAAQFAREALRAPAPDPQVAGPAYKVLGDVQARRGHVADAVHDYETALAHSTERYAPLIRASLAHALVAAGTPASLERAAGLLAHAAPAGDPALDAQLQRTRAGLLLAQGRPEDAKAAYLALVADPRGADGAYYRLWAWDGVARSSLALGQADAAAQAFDQALADMDAVRARFRSEEFKMGLFSDLQSIFERALALQLRLGHPERAFAISEQSRSRALLDSVRGRVPPQPGAAPDATPADPPLATLQQTLHADETLVVFHSLPEQLQVWLVDAHGIGSRQLPITRGDLADRVGIVRTALAHALPDAAQLADELGAALLEPLQLPPGQRLIIVPHGALHYLPFQALRLHGRYLIETHPIAIAPSARVAAQLIGQPPPAPSLAAFGNPRIGDPFDLPGAQAEVQELAGMFARHQVFTREQATKTRFRQAVAQASIVHVAAHAVADQVDPLYSRILLATEDGRRSDLEAHEIMQLALRGTALVTLSACESGLGRIARGDEVQGFTRAFLQAGSTSLIASLWPVSDSATELLMRRLYRELSRGRDVQGAMQAAQLALLHDPRFAHPFFWAPFNLIGNWRLALMPGA